LFQVPAEAGQHSGDFAGLVASLVYLPYRSVFRPQKVQACAILHGNLAWSLHPSSSIACLTHLLSLSRHTGCLPLFIQDICLTACAISPVGRPRLPRERVATHLITTTMSGPIPESIPTSADPRSKRPTKKRALTPRDAYASRLRLANLSLRPQRLSQMSRVQVQVLGLASSTSTKRAGGASTRGCA
jgi:hypothetical protein